jgi:hypothetical protein
MSRVRDGQDGRGGRAERVADERRRAREHRCRGGAHREGLRGVARHEHAPRAVPVDDRAAERRGQSRRHQEPERHDAGGGRAAVAVGEDQNRDPRAELRQAIEPERGAHPT